jgi:CRP/FNR family cyclic AMP-dependent transcriptional regulator
MKTWQQLAEEGALGARTPSPDRELLLMHGEPARRCHFLYSGAAEIFHTTAEGRSAVVKLVTAPTLLGLPEIMAGESEYLAGIRMAGEAVTFAMEREPFFTIMESNRAASLEATRDISLAFTGAARQEPARLFDTEVVLAALLLAYADVFGEANGDRVLLTLKRSQAELAEAVGASERQVQRVLQQWKAESLVAKEGGRRVILRPDIVREIAGPLADGMVHRWRD